MAFVTNKGEGRWELRESARTEDGPRSRTLVAFRVLTPEAIELARSRSRGDLDQAEVRRAARRAGAPVAEAPADAGAAMVLAELAAGRRPKPVIARLLADALPGSGQEPTAAERAVAPWIGADLDRRGEALSDLLLLADRLPAPRRDAALAFPRLAPHAS